MHAADPSREHPCYWIYIHARISTTTIRRELSHRLEAKSVSRLRQQRRTMCSSEELLDWRNRAKAGHGVYTWSMNGSAKWKSPAERSTGKEADFSRRAQ